jgi:hypothetical protein
MGDHCQVTIQIGGKIKRADLERLFQAIEAECMSTDWGTTIFEDVEDLGTAIDELHLGQALYLTADEVNYGNLDSMEPLLKELGLTYVKWNGEGGGYSSYVEFWEPGLEQPYEWHADRDERPLMSAGVIRDCIASGKLEEALVLMERAQNLKMRLEIVEDVAVAA